MPYQQPRQDVSFRSRSVLDDTKKRFDEIREKEIADRRYGIELDKQQREFEKALKVWDKSQDALYKEQVDFWDKVSPTMSKLASDTLVQAYEWKVTEDAKRAKRRYDALAPEQKVLITQQASEFFSTVQQNDLTNAQLSAQAKEAGFQDLSEYLDNLSNMGLTNLIYEVGNHNLDRLQADISLIRVENPGISRSGWEVEVQRLEDRALQSSNSAGVDHDLIVGLLKPRTDQIISQARQKFHLENVNERNQRNFQDTKRSLRLNLAAIDITLDNPDSEAIKRLVLTTPGLINTLRNQSAVNGNEPSGVTAQNELLKILQDWVDQHTDDEDRLKAQNFVDAFLQGDLTRYGVLERMEVEHTATGEMVTLGQLNPNLFGANWYKGDPALPRASTVVSIVAEYKKQLKGANQDACRYDGWCPKRKDGLEMEGEGSQYDYTTDTEGDDGNPDNDWRLEMTERIKAGNPPSEAELDEYIQKMANRGYPRNILLEIIDFKEEILAGTNSVIIENTNRTLLNIHTQNNGEGIKQDNPFLATVVNRGVNIEEDDTGRYIMVEDTKISIVRSLYGEGEGSEQAIEQSELKLAELFGGDGQPLNIYQFLGTRQLTEEVRRRVIAEREGLGDDETFNEAASIAQHTAAVVEETKAEMESQGSEHEFYIDSNGTMPNLMVGNSTLSRRRATEITSGHDWQDERDFRRTALSQLSLLNAQRLKIEHGSEFTSTLSTAEGLLMNEEQFKLVSEAVLVPRNLGSRRRFETGTPRERYTGAIPHEIVELALEAGMDPWTFLQAQYQARKAKTGEDLPVFYEQIQMPEESQAFWNNLSVQEISDIYQSVRSLGIKFDPNAPNVVAQRLIINSVTPMRQNPTDPPHQPHIANALEELTGGRTDFKDEAADLYGRYGLRREDIEAFYEARGHQPEGDIIEDYLSDPSKQRASINWVLEYHYLTTREQNVGCRFINCY